MRGQMFYIPLKIPDGIVQEKANIDEYFWIRSLVEVRNDTEFAWIFVEGSRSGKLNFSKHM